MQPTSRGGKAEAVSRQCSSSVDMVVLKGWDAARPAPSMPPRIRKVGEIKKRRKNAYRELVDNSQNSCTISLFRIIPTLNLTVSVFKNIFFLYSWRSIPFCVATYQLAERLCFVERRWCRVWVPDQDKFFLSCGCMSGPTGFCVTHDCCSDENYYFHLFKVQ